MDWNMTLLQTLCGLEAYGYDTGNKELQQRAVKKLTIHALHCDKCKVLGETAYRERYRVAQDVDIPSGSAIDAASRLRDAEGEALPPGGYTYRPSEVSADATAGEGSAPDERPIPGGRLDHRLVKGTDSVARADDEGAALAQANHCTCDEKHQRPNCPEHGLR